MDTIQQLDREYIASTYGRFPVTLVSGKGSLAEDEQGKRYIDFGAGIAVNTFGYCDTVWQEAVKNQLDALQHTSNLYYTAPCSALAAELCRRTGMKKVFFSNSGAEANECAIKAARKYGAEHHGRDAYWIITLKNSFHGRTLTTLAATGQDHFHELFQPLTPGFLYAEPEDLEGLTELTASHKVCGILIECIQGEGGVNALSRDFVQGIAKLCREKDILLLCDEVQAGNGRSGQLYSYMNDGVTPDVVTTAKGLGGGLPIGVTMLGEKVQDIFHPGDNGSTFGGNPVVCAGALSILKRLDDDFLAEVRAKSNYLFRTLSKAPGVKQVTGMGLMIGVEPEKGSVAELAGRCLEKGLLVLTAGQNRLRLLPALNIPDSLLQEGTEILKEVLAD